MSHGVSGTCVYHTRWGKFDHERMALEAIASWFLHSGCERSLEDLAHELTAALMSRCVWSWREKVLFSTRTLMHFMLRTHEFVWLSHCMGLQEMRTDHLAPEKRSAATA